MLVSVMEISGNECDVTWLQSCAVVDLMNL